MNDLMSHLFLYWMNQFLNESLDSITNTFLSHLSPPSGETMQSTQTLFEAPGNFQKVYFDRYHKHQCLYMNY
jgi:hypothetical protein